MKIESGEIVIAVLHSPREKILGTLNEINSSGVFLRGIDLNYFDEWATAIKNDEPFVPMQDYFFPMWRLEKLMRDESSFAAASMAEQFQQKTGLNLSDF